jgi:PhnB protein
MHARLIVDNMLLMGSDCPEGQAEKPQGFAVALGFADPAEAERVYNELSVNGSVQMALQETFWARRFAMFTDQFGTPWMINCEKPA